MFSAGAAAPTHGPVHREVARLAVLGDTADGQHQHDEEAAGRADDRVHLLPAARIGGHGGIGRRILVAVPQRGSPCHRRPRRRHVGAAAGRPAGRSGRHGDDGAGRRHRRRRRTADRRREQTGGMQDGKSVGAVRDCARHRRASTPTSSATPPAGSRSPRTNGIPAAPTPRPMSRPACSTPGRAASCRFRGGSTASCTAASCRAAAEPATGARRTDGVPAVGLLVRPDRRGQPTPFWTEKGTHGG